MTLDWADDEPVRLWTRLATAVERLGQGLGGAALMGLGVRGAGIEAAVDELMNGLVAYGRPVAIVLDGLHTVRSERSLCSIGHAIERLPANARLLGVNALGPGDQRGAPAGGSGTEGDPLARARFHGRRSA